MVVAPIAGSPAEEAGIRSGDKILEINGEPTSEMSLIEATLKIRGKEGTKVKLLVLHRGEDIPIEIEVIRAEIDLPSVDWEMLPENIAHLGITNFSGRTDYEFASALEDIESQGATAIVLDLRDNPGGMLNAAVSVASQFLEEGLVLYTVDSEGERTNWEVKPEGLALDTPLAVLVNGGSASASEVVAGALQDNQRGPIIGVKTLGKGSVNRVHQLSNGGALYITYARWFTPSGGQIDEEGIIPDIEVEMTAEDVENDRDPQLEQAIEYLTQRR
jgi:carboxyl-terminal processing protease